MTDAEGYLLEQLFARRPRAPGSEASGAAIGRPNHRALPGEFLEREVPVNAPAPPVFLAATFM